MKCPACSETGEKVPNQTVKNLVSVHCQKKIGESDYYLCMNPRCEVAYYNSELVFEKSALKVPLWYKDDANPKYACYCRKITQEEVTKAVRQQGLTDAEEIMEYLRGKVKSNCRINNPTGHCCHPAFNETIKKAITMTTQKKSNNGQRKPPNTHLDS